MMSTTMRDNLNGVRVSEAVTLAEVRDCFAVMVQLRAHLREAEFVERVERQRSAGYRLAALRDANERVCAVAGYRVFENFVSGKQLYVDDLVTDTEHRSRGYGAMLLRWLEDHARACGCARLELDSGVQRARAHAFYSAHGMSISSFHFRKELA